MQSRVLPSSVLSRRQIIGAGTASLVLAPALAEIAPPIEPAPIAAGQNGANLLTIAVSIEGKGPFHFVVDTGADRTVIATDVAGQLGLNAGDPVMVEGVVRSVRADTVRIEKISVGAVERDELVTPVLPRPQLLADGYLGLDVIDGYRVTLDFRNSELTLTEPRHRQLVGWAPPNEIPIRLAGSSGHLRSIECIIDGVRATAFVDSGAEISVGNSLLYKALVDRDPGYAQQDAIPLTGVTGGVVLGHITTVKHVKLSGLSFEESRIAIADLQIFQMWEIDDRPALLIGMNWLRQFSKVSVDYARKELWFDLASRKREVPLRCKAPDAAAGNCRYLLGSPDTTPRPSVPI